MLILPKIGLLKEPRQARSQATVEAIVTATGLFSARHGFFAIDTTQIAERAGVSIGSLYQYFASKEAILVELAKRAMQRTASAFEECLISEIGRPLESSVTVLVNEFTGLVGRVPHRLRREILFSMPAAGANADATFHHRYLEAAGRFLLPHATRNDARAVAFARFNVLASIDGILEATGFAEQDLLSDRDYVGHVDKMLLASIRVFVG
jgi:AcrR family transcriptional regulator